MSVRPEFIAALRAMPEEQHVTGDLRTDPWGNTPECFCALGVGYDLYRAHHSGVYWFGSNLYNGNSLMPYRAALEWLGVSGTTEGHIVDLNDEERATFAQIADYLESL